MLAKDQPYVFISYARPDQTAAEKVEAILIAAGVRVFRDANDIRAGADWDMTIEEALRECQRMILLLSRSSMPYRKEVHREWFYFDQKRKPIYPLFIEDCELHTRLIAYNYIDARGDLHGAVKRMLDDLGRDFDLPEPMTGADRIGVKGCCRWRRYAALSLAKSCCAQWRFGSIASSRASAGAKRSTGRVSWRACVMIGT